MCDLPKKCVVGKGLVCDKQAAAVTGAGVLTPKNAVPNRY